MFLLVTAYLGVMFVFGFLFGLGLQLAKKIIK
jgi:hypothetical protein